MSRKIPYKDIMNRIKDDVDYIAEEAYKKGYAEGEKQAKENYQKGLSDAWECAKKIACMESDGGMPCQVLADIFDCDGRIIATHSASEAIAKIKAYEEEQNKIRLGDEVILKSDCTKAVIVATGIKGWWRVITENRCTNTWHENDIEKTGRHFDEIETLMEKMKYKEN